MYILDTDVLSATRRLERADRMFRRWAEANLGDRFFLSVVSVLEIEIGAARRARKDPAQAAVLRRWIEEQVLLPFGRRILPVDVEVARRWARLHVPDPRPERDAIIAATALVHGFTVVTRNVRDFEPMGVRVLDPWSPDQQSTT